MNVRTQVIQVCLGPSTHAWRGKRLYEGHYQAQYLAFLSLTCFQTF